MRSYEMFMMPDGKQYPTHVITVFSQFTSRKYGHRAEIWLNIYC